MRCIVSMLTGLRCASWFARAKPTAVMPRCDGGFSLRTSSARCAFAATLAGGVYVGIS